MQEIDLFVEPAGYLGAKIVFAVQELNLRMDRVPYYSLCADAGDMRIFGLLEAANNSSAVELNASLHTAGLVTKVFLNAEIYNKENLFINGARYIETLVGPRAIFMSTDYMNSMDFLLGTHNFRHFVFDP